MRRLLSWALAFIAWAADPAAAGPTAAHRTAAVPDPGRIVAVEHRPGWAGHYGYPRPAQPWRYRGFALRLGWGYPAYGYPWDYPAPPITYPPAPLMIAPAPTVGTAEWYDYCAAKYRSFEPTTGLYTTYSGERRSCL
jgi:hypothetical protein